MRYAKCCKDCVLNHDCLFQRDDDVESCGDFEYGTKNEDIKNIHQLNLCNCSLKGKAYHFK
jgi:hypothetical protein